MKNRKKALIIAIICLAAAAVLYLLVVKLSQRSEDADCSDDSLVISSVDSGQITAISYEKDGKSLSFRKEDGTWYNAEDKSFPVDQDSLTTMTNSITIRKFNIFFITTALQSPSESQRPLPKCLQTSLPLFLCSQAVHQ